MPIIRVEMLAGRSDDQKRALARELTEACVRALGAAPDSIKVLLFDVPKQHWASAGQLYSDKDPHPGPPGG